MENDNPIKDMNQESVNSLEEEFLEEVQKHTVELVDYVNSHSTDRVAEGMWRGVSHSHRTLQQNFWRTILKVAEKYSQNRFDDRNEASVKFCERLTQLVKDEHIHLPFI